ncbi:polymer-forming cytoskeletal protein [Sulfuricella sp.]|uniref:bactofilin family protein n=1 Tax=Sulfuricella sp. TaxID=2099377 RepID=UPI002C8464FD|nr:polymer-forming cytoskeletal protein [Sulfuricella sp.]HUX65077.1 polymer-forming cytoskeletal protein [Sulfuricella sp.]
MLKNFMHSTTKSNFNETNKVMEPAKAPVEVKPENQAPPKKIAPREEGNKLIVGPNIKLKGSEITDCHILVVEGRVEASMNSRDIRIAEGGVFSGKAEIDVAEVRGLFEGELTARKQLVIYASGKVTGKIRYGALTIEEGGVISGDVATIVKDTQNAKTVTIAEPIKAVPSPAETPEAEHVHASSVLGRTQLGGRRS